MITINDGLIWFCEKGVNGCSTMPVDYAYATAWIVLITFIFGIILGRLSKHRSKK